MTALEVDNNEVIARILHRCWIVDGVLQTNAFALNEGETYISVNRMSVDSFDSDICVFVGSHPLYRISDTDEKYSRAEMNVADVRALTVALGGKSINVSIEVEPRDAHYKSHAGIFARIDGKNIKGGQNTEYQIDENLTVSTDAIHQKLRVQLVKLSKVNTFPVLSTN